MSSARVLAGYKTKGSQAEIVLPVEYSGSNTLEKYDQGVYVNDISVLINPATVRLRPNNDFLKIKNGVPVQVTVGSYDDTESPVPLVWVSGSVGTVYQKSQIPVSFFAQSHPQGGKGSGYAVAPSHFQMDNDFGQPDTYQDGAAYEETTTEIDPIVVIQTPPAELILPVHIVNSADQTSVDGLIDVFDTRKKVDRDLEIPFPIRDTWASLGVTDTYRRSVLVEDQTESLAVRVLSDGESFTGTDAFLDAGDEFGLREILEFDPALLSSGSRSPEGYVKFPTATVSPFLESNDAELTADLVAQPTDALWSVVMDMTGSRDFPTHDYLGRDSVSLSHGYDYDSSATRIDSLAFGGLLRR